ncbi:MAG: hypothetical protein DLM58_19180, partial [Pseudonocardiales bacterium]
MGQAERQPIRLGAVPRGPRRPGERAAQVVSNLVERDPPGGADLPRRNLESSALSQTPTQVARQCLVRLARLLEPIVAVLADGLQGPVASPARPRERDQQTLFGQAGEDTGNMAGRHWRPTGHNRRRCARGERLDESRDPPQ